jgi:uncharacterized protein (TIGR04255 family)
MRERFKNPPLVELIAELRWGSSGGVLSAAQPQGAAPILLALTGQHEEFFMRFGSKAGAVGYDLVERVLPQGFPAMPFQVVYRFRKKGQEQGTTLYQVGAGIFSANSTPPYRFWDDFKPVLEQGLQLLLETRNPSEREMSFTGASLRYINAFGDKFTEGRSMAVFIRDVLGFVVEPPAPIQDEMPPDKELKPSLQLLIPLQPGQDMVLRLTDGLVSGEQAVIMDLTVSKAAHTQPRERDLMAVFDTAHEVAHRVFVGITKKLFDKMELIEGDEM